MLILWFVIFSNLTHFPCIKPYFFSVLYLQWIITLLKSNFCLICKNNFSFVFLSISSLTIPFNSTFRSEKQCFLLYFLEIEFDITIQNVHFHFHSSQLYYNNVTVLTAQNNKQITLNDTPRISYLNKNVKVHFIN